MIPICTISLRFFSPPEKPTFTPRFIMSMSRPSASACSRARRRKSPAESSASPRARRWALSAVRRNWTLETPGISTGYWKPRNRPCGGALVRLHARADPRRRASPSLRSPHSRAARRARRPSVDLPAPFGPMIAWTSPGVQREADPLEDRLAVDGGVEVFDLKHQISDSHRRSGFEARSLVAFELRMRRSSVAVDRRAAASPSCDQDVPARRLRVRRDLTDARDRLAQRHRRLVAAHRTQPR